MTWSITDVQALLVAILSTTYNVTWILAISGKLLVDVLVLHFLIPTYLLGWCFDLFPPPSPFW